MHGHPPFLPFPRVIRLVALASTCLMLLACSADDDARIAPEAGSAGRDDPRDDDAGEDDAGHADASTIDASQLDASTRVCSACGACEEEVQLNAAQHVTGTILYLDLPPAGGPHNPCWAAFKAHDTPVPAERWVHNLEHGGVVFLYNCPEGCDTEVEQLQTLVDGTPQALLTEYEGLPARFAVVAWGHRLVSDCFDAEAFLAFYRGHVDQAPESITAGPPTGCR